MLLLTTGKKIQLMPKKLQVMMVLLICYTMQINTREK